MARVWDQVLRTHFFLVPPVFARIFPAILVFLAAVVLATTPVYAKSKYAGIVMDAKTGRTLYSYRANETRYPASLTKMMTLYMMFEALEQGKISKKTRIKISKYAASMQPSKLGIKPGNTLSVEHAIMALVTKSANDVAAAVAEHLGGSEKNFAARMTKRAKQLGMNRTIFRNASGLTAKGQVTSAKDMALLGIALREHYPDYYRYFSTRSFKYGKAKYGNHNRLLGRIKGVDGIKTGYTSLSGFNLVSSVERDKRSIVAVVLGGKSGNSRNAQMEKLISSYLRKATRRQKSGMLVAKLNIGGSLSNTQLAKAVKLPKLGPLPLSRPDENNPLGRRINQAHLASVAFAPSARALPQASIDAIRTQLLALSVKKIPVPNPNPMVRISTAQSQIAQNQQTQNVQLITRRTNTDLFTTSAIRPQVALTQAPVNRITTIKLVEEAGIVRLAKAPKEAETKSKPVAKTNPVAKPADTQSAKVSSPALTPKPGWHVQIAAVPDRQSAIAMLAKVRTKMPALDDSSKYGDLTDYLEPVVKNGTQLYRARFAGFNDKNSARSACKAMKRKKISCLAINGAASG